MRSFTFAILALGLAACSNQNFSLPTQDNNYLQTPVFNNKVDIVFMADDSSSMAVFQRGLSAQMNAMVSTLNSMGMDYHIAVTTSSVGTGFTGGKFVGSPKYLTNTTANIASLLTSRLLVGQSGSDLEQGLSSLKTALSPTNLSGENAGFLRSDALLAIIVLSNEDDYSAGSVQSYADFFNSLKQPFANGARSWVFNFLGITALSSGCTTQEGPFGAYIEPGLRYMDLVNATEGITESICTTNWGQVVSNVKVRINQLLTDFYLNRKPKVETIKVTVSGVSVAAGSANGWTYEEKIENGVTYYFIRFHGSAVPSLYDSIGIKFDPFSAI
jgi:hypothetical protein